MVPVRFDGRILLARRAAAKTHPLTWEFPAGSALAGETSEEAVIRELAEESGLRVAPADLTLLRRITESRAFFDLYIARVAEPDVIVPDPAEVAEAHWADLAEFEQRKASGDFAGPWYDRFDVLGTDLIEAIQRASDLLDAHLDPLEGR